MLRFEHVDNGEFRQFSQLLPGPKQVVYDKGLKPTNVVILGKQGTGKTTIFKKIHEYFAENPFGTTRKVANRLEIKTDDVNVVVSDIRLPSILNKFCMYSISKGDAFILVYAVDDPDSFTYVETLKEYLQERQSQGVPILVIGNKTDLPRRTLPYEVTDCIVSIDWEAKYLEMSGIKEDVVLSIMEMLFPKKKQSCLLIPCGGEFETFEFRGMKFRPRAHTDSKVAKLKKKRDAVDVNDSLTDEQKMLKRTSRRFSSLPGFIIRKSPMHEEKVNKTHEQCWRSPLRSLNCLKGADDSNNTITDLREDTVGVLFR